MTISEVRPSRAVRVLVLLLGTLAEALTIGLALWIGSAADVSRASGGAQYTLLALFIAPGVGAISLGSAVIGARRTARVFAYLTLLALATFSLFIWFAFYGLPLLMIWIAFTVGLHAARIGDAERA
jgi:hypothetical protein